MSHITRRQMISGLAATTAAFSIGCGRGAKHDQPRAAKLATGAGVKCAQLNVVLHGLMVIGVLTNPPSPNEGIRLVFPDIPDGGAGSPAHQYFIGNVTAGTSGDSDLICFRPGAAAPGGGALAHQLLGLSQGSHPDFSKEPSTFFLPNVGNSLQLNETGKRVITMPWPKSIMSLNKMYVSATASPQCEGSVPLISAPTTDSANGKLTSICTIHILTYDCNPNDANGPRLIRPDGTDMGWIPQPRMVPPACTNVQTATLHIFAEPQQVVKNVNHVVHAFHDLMATIQKNGGDLSTDYSFNSFTIGNAKLCDPDGKCRPGIISELDLANLPTLHNSPEGGEVANCVQGVINLG